MDWPYTYNTTGSNRGLLWIGIPKVVEEEVA